jgi:predicted SAM-dependent methyltransferase
MRKTNDLSIVKLKKIQKLELLARQFLKSEDVTHGMKRVLRRVLRETPLYKNYLKSREENGHLAKKLEVKEVQVGGGRHVLKGFLNIDIVPPADLIWDVREELPIRDRCCEFIFTEHFLEHIDYPISAKKFIRECARILKPKGKLVVGVPDGELILRSYCKKDLEVFNRLIKTWYSKRNCLEHINTYIDLVNYHFRDQDDDPKYTPHLWTYDYEKLESLLKESGFSRVKRWKFDKSIANPEREYGSIYVEGIK